MAENRIGMLPANGFAALSRLQQLRLEGNVITAVHELAFRGLSRLQLLELSGNLITLVRAGTLQPLAQLAVLRLGSNRLTALPARMLAGLALLRVLDLAQNDIRWVDENIWSSLSNDTALRISMEGNPSRCQTIIEKQAQRVVVVCSCSPNFVGITRKGDQLASGCARSDQLLEIHTSDHDAFTLAQTPDDDLALGDAEDVVVGEANPVIDSSTLASAAYYRENMDHSDGGGGGDSNSNSDEDVWFAATAAAPKQQRSSASASTAQSSRGEDEGEEVVGDRESAQARLMRSPLRSSDKEWFGKWWANGGDDIRRDGGVRVPENVGAARNQFLSVARSMSWADAACGLACVAALAIVLAWAVAAWRRRRVRQTAAQIAQHVANLSALCDIPDSALSVLPGKLAVDGVFKSETVAFMGLLPVRLLLCEVTAVPMAATESASVSASVSAAPSSPAAPALPAELQPVNQLLRRLQALDHAHVAQLYGLCAVHPRLEPAEATTPETGETSEARLRRRSSGARRGSQRWESGGLLPTLALVRETGQRGRLRSLLAGSPEVALPMKLKFAWQCAAGLAYLHEQRILHMDLSAAHVLVGGDFTLKLVDPGLPLLRAALTRDDVAACLTRREMAGSHSQRAEEVDAGWSDSSMAAALAVLKWDVSMADQQNVCGTAPELLAGLPAYTSASDVFAYGSLLLEMWTQQPPWHELSSPRDIQERLLQGQRPSLPADMPESFCPPAVAALMDACWAQDPARRPSTSSVLATMTSLCHRVADV